jgi:hypothetical protein
MISMKIKPIIILITIIIITLYGTSGCIHLETQNNHTSSDTDNDGLTDNQETSLGSNISNPDSDNDGIYDFFETKNGTAIDTDNDNIFDIIDPDDDGDDVPTYEEQPDSNGDGNPADARDHDEDGLPDYLDDDDDNDGILTKYEIAFTKHFSDDVDGDHVVNYLDIDSDNDSNLDMDEGTGDRDGDNIPNFLDANDSDGPIGDLDSDGATNQEEDYTNINPPDSDNDGTPDYLDPESNAPTDDNLDLIKDLIG